MGWTKVGIFGLCINPVEFHPNQMPRGRSFAYMQLVRKNSGMLKHRLIPVPLFKNWLLIRCLGFKLHQIFGDSIQEALCFTQWTGDGPLRTND